MRIQSVAADVCLQADLFTLEYFAYRFKGFLGADCAARIAGAATVLHQTPRQHRAGFRNPFAAAKATARTTAEWCHHRRGCCSERGAQRVVPTLSGKTACDQIYIYIIYKHIYYIICVQLRRRFCLRDTIHASYLFVAHVGHNKVVTAV